MKLRQVKWILICVDLQLGFLDEDSWGGNRNNKDEEKMCAKIISTYRAHNEKIIYVRHSSKDTKTKIHPDTEGFKFNPLCAPINDETVLTKSVNSCLFGTGLKNIFRCHVLQYYCNYWINYRPLHFYHNKNGRELWLQYIPDFWCHRYF